VEEPDQIDPCAKGDEASFSFSLIPRKKAYHDALGPQRSWIAVAIFRAALCSFRNKGVDNSEQLHPLRAIGVPASTRRPGPFLAEPFGAVVLFEERLQLPVELLEGGP
jgi:hypothetical protein